MFPNEKKRSESGSIMSPSLSSLPARFWLQNEEKPESWRRHFPGPFAAAFGIVLSPMGMAEMVADRD